MIQYVVVLTNKALRLDRRGLGNGHRHRAARGSTDADVCRGYAGARVLRGDLGAGPDRTVRAVAGGASGHCLRRVVGAVSAGSSGFCERVAAAGAGYAARVYPALPAETDDAYTTAIARKWRSDAGMAGDSAGARRTEEVLA